MTERVLPRMRGVHALLARPHAYTEDVEKMSERKESTKEKTQDI